MDAQDYIPATEGEIMPATVDTAPPPPPPPPDQTELIAEAAGEELVEEPVSSLPSPSPPLPVIDEDNQPLAYKSIVANEMSTRGWSQAFSSIAVNQQFYGVLYR